MSSPSSPENTNNNDNNSDNKPSTPSEKKTKNSPKKGVSVVDRLTSSPSPTRNTRNDTADENNNNNKTRISPPATARSTSPFAPALAQKEYISELRARQDSQLTSIASYLESHVREPFGALCGKNLGGWTYGPSYSRTVESLEPEAESYPPTRSAWRTVLLSSARSLPFNVQQEVRQREQHSTHFSHGQHHQRSPSRSSNNGSPASTSRSHANYSVASSSRPGTARSAATSVYSSRPSTSNGLVPTSFYNVVLEAPFNNVHPTSARFTHADNNNPSLMNVRSATMNNKNTLPAPPTSSGRPLAAEYYYPSKKRALRNDELVSKSDRAVQKHRDKQRKLEVQKEKLKNAAPMEFRWQV